MINRKYISYATVFLVLIIILIGLEWSDEENLTTDDESKIEKKESKFEHEFEPPLLDENEVVKEIHTLAPVSISEEKFKTLKRVYHDIRERRDNPVSAEGFWNANVEWATIGDFWVPNGLSVEQLKELLGDPFSESTNEINYHIKTAYTSYIDTYKIVDGQIQDRKLRLDVESDPTSETVVEKLSQKYRNTYALREHFRNSNKANFHDANFSLNNLFYFWGPDGLSLDQLKSVIGGADWERSNRIGYEFDTGKEVHQRIFEVNENGIRLLSEDEI